MTGKPITILVIDDDKPIRDMLEGLFASVNYRVILSETGKEALAHNGLNEVDVALIDIHLPGKLNGHAVLQELNKLYPDMAKILMSGQAAIDDAIAAFSEQAFSFIKKPFVSLKEVLILVERGAEARALQIENRKYARELEEANVSLEKRIEDRTSELHHYKDMLSHLFLVSSQIGLLERPDEMLEFVCKSIVDAGIFRKAVILLADTKFRVQHVGIWIQDGVSEPIKLSLQNAYGQPLRPFDFNAVEEQIGSAIYSRIISDSVSNKNDIDEWIDGDKLSVPLTRQDGTVFGYLGLASPVLKSKPSVEILQVIDTLLHHSSLQIEANQLRFKLKSYNEELEQKVQERTAELRFSQEKFSRLVGLTTDIVYILDEKNKIIYLNDAFTKTLGYVRENYFGRSLRPLIEELATNNPMNIAALQALESTDDEHTIHHVELLTRKGDKRILEINRTVIRQGGLVKGSQGIVRDITEHRALLQQLISAERLAATGRLAAGVAHEINNPLQAITSHLSSALKKISTKEDPKQNLELITEGIERIRQIVRGMLDLHRGANLIHSPLNLNELVQKVTTLVSRQLREEDIKLKLTLNPQIPLMEGSAQEIQQVILNLILNAIEAMPDGGELSIHSNYDTESMSILLVIQDTGIGISEDHLAQIFEPFFTYKPSGNGTGLGLYLSKNIIELHHGSISVESEKGKGAKFTLRFSKDS